MAKTSTKFNVKGTKSSASSRVRAAQGKAKDVVKAVRKSGLTNRQIFKLSKMALKNEKLAIKGKPGLAKSIGSAIAEATTPIATNITAQKVSEQAYATKSQNAEKALGAWTQGMSGNPGEGGQEGQSQGGSTTTTTSAGSFRSIID